MSNDLVGCWEIEMICSNPATIGEHPTNKGWKARNLYEPRVGQLQRSCNSLDLKIDVPGYRATDSDAGRLRRGVTAGESAPTKPEEAPAQTGTEPVAPVRLEAVLFIFTPE